MDGRFFAGRKVIAHLLEGKPQSLLQELPISQEKRRDQAILSWATISGQSAQGLMKLTVKGPTTACPYHQSLSCEHNPIPALDCPASRRGSLLCQKLAIKLCSNLLHLVWLCGQGAISPAESAHSCSRVTGVSNRKELSCHSVSNLSPLSYLSVKQKIMPTLLSLAKLLLSLCQLTPCPL